MSNGKVTIIHLIVGLIKKISLYETRSENKIKFELYLSNYATNLT